MICMKHIYHTTGNMTSEYTSAAGKEQSRRDSPGYLKGNRIKRGFLQQEEENRIISIYQEAVRTGDEGAQKKHLDILIRNIKGYVKRVAMQYRDCGVPTEDLESEGYLGVIEAIKRFDEGRGVKLITYSEWYIRKCMLAYIYNHSTNVRIPIHQHRKEKKVKDTYQTLVARGEEHTTERVAEITGMPEPFVERAIRRVNGRETSLYLTASRKRKDCIIDLLPDPNGASPEEIYISQRTKEDVQSALGMLNEKEKYVITRRFGAEGEEPTLKEVGDSLGISRERVRQIEETSLKRIRVMMKSRHLKKGHKGKK